MPVIELQSVSKTYQNAKGPAIVHVSFRIQRGEILSLLGPSGSGKTTLLRLIAGFELPDEGVILSDGIEMSRSGQAIPPENRKIGMVFQDGGLFPHLTVSANIAFGLYRYNKPEQRRKVSEMLHLVSMEGLGDRYPHELSGGQQQRVAIARALAPNPIILLMDEPFSNLDPDLRSKMRGEIHLLLKRIGMTAILVTHDHEEAFAMADQIAVLHAGRLEQIDTPENIYHLPKTPFVADFVGSADFVPGEIRSDGFIYTEIGRFPHTGNDPVGNGIAVMIRPDDIHFVPDENGCAQVVSKQFRGSENLYALSLPSGRRVHSIEHSLYDYPPGTRVRLELTATHTVVFENPEL